MSANTGIRQRIRVWLGMGHDGQTFVGRLIPAITYGRWAVHQTPAYDGQGRFSPDDGRVTITHIPSGRQAWQFDRDDLDAVLAIAAWLAEHDAEYIHPAMLDADWRAAGNGPAGDGIGIVRACCAAGIAPWYWSNWLYEQDEAAASVRLDGETQAVTP